MIALLSDALRMASPDQPRSPSSSGSVFAVEHEESVASSTAVVHEHRVRVFFMAAGSVLGGDSRRSEGSASAAELSEEVQHGRPDHHDQERGEDEEHHRKEYFGRHPFGGFLGPLAPGLAH